VPQEIQQSGASLRSATSHPKAVFRKSLASDIGRPAVSGLTVTLVGNHRPVAVANTDIDGRFAFRVPGVGVYRVFVRHGSTSSERTCRVWTSAAAPPHAPREILLPLRAPSATPALVRGQREFRPFPVTSLQQAATVTGLAVGAIAAPVIYHNTLQDNKIPSSP